MTVRMKVLVGALRELADSNGKKISEEITMQAVTNDGGVNASWSKWTPSADHRFVVSNPNAWGHFPIGGYFYVDFTPTTQNDPL